MEASPHGKSEVVYGDTSVVEIAKPTEIEGGIDKLMGEKHGDENKDEKKLGVSENIGEKDKGNTESEKKEGQNLNESEKENEKEAPGNTTEGEKKNEKESSRKDANEGMKKDEKEAVECETKDRNKILGNNGDTTEKIDEKREKEGEKKDGGVKKDEIKAVECETKDGKKIAGNNADATAEKTDEKNEKEVPGNTTEKKDESAKKDEKKAVEYETKDGKNITGNNSEKVDEKKEKGGEKKDESVKKDEKKAVENETKDGKKITAEKVDEKKEKEGEKKDESEKKAAENETKDGKKVVEESKPAPKQPKMQTVCARFHVVLPEEYANSKVFVVGSVPELGSGELQNALPLTHTNNGHYVSAFTTFNVILNATCEYRFVLEKPASFLGSLFGAKDTIIAETNSRKLNTKTANQYTLEFAFPNKTKQRDQAESAVTILHFLSQEPKREDEPRFIQEFVDFIRSQTPEKIGKWIGDIKLTQNDAYHHCVCVFLSLQKKDKKKKLPLPDSFPAARFFRGCVVFAGPDHLANAQSLSATLRALMTHSIAHSPPSMWVPNIPFLLSVPEGLSYLNSLNKDSIPAAESIFWEELAKVWHCFANKKITKFVEVLLRACMEMDHLMTLLSCLTQEQFEDGNIREFCHTSFGDLQNDSLWEDMLALPDSVPLSWHQVLAPGSEMRGLLEDLSVGYINTIVTDKRAPDISPSTLGRIVTKYAIYDEEQQLDLVRRLLGVRNEYFQSWAFEILKNTTNRDQQIQSLGAMYFDNFVHQRTNDLIYLLGVLNHMCIELRPDDEHVAILYSKLEGAMQRAPLRQLFSVAQQITEMPTDERILKHFFKHSISPKLSTIVTLNNIEESLVNFRVGETLSVHHWLISNVVCALLDLLQKNFGQRSINEIVKQETLIATLLRASGEHAHKILGHPWIKQIEHVLLELSGSIKSEKIKLSTLQSVLKDENSLAKLFCLVDKKFKTSCMKNARMTVAKFSSQIDQVQQFLSHFCTIVKAIDVETHLKQLEALKKDYSNMQFSQITGPFPLSLFSNFASISLITKLKSSTIFSNFIKKRLETIPLLTVEYLYSASTSLYEIFVVYCQNFVILSEMTFSKADEAFSGITPNNLQNEINIINEVLESTHIELPPNEIAVLNAYIQSDDLREKCDNLYKVYTMLAIQTMGEKNILTYPRYFKSPEGFNKALGTYKYYVDIIQPTLTGFDDFDWAAIEVLSKASDLIYFVQEVLSEDLRNLIHAVEDHSDHFIKGNTVSCLIDVQRFLAPLLTPGTVSDRKKLFIQQLKSDNKISAKIAICSDNVHGLRRTYNNLANRGEVTKEIIGNAVQQGSYTFHLNSVVMSYVGKSNTPNTFSLTDLLDLRSRALLIVNSQNVAAIQSSKDAEDSLQQTMLQFINHVELAQSIVEILAALADLGHFSFRDFSRKITASTELTRQLQTLRDDLHTAFTSWSTQLDEVRKKFYFLTYFHPKQLYHLLDFVQDTEPHLSYDLWNALKFINPQFEPEMLEEGKRDKVKLTDGEEHLFDTLCSLGKFLHKIFDGLPLFSAAIEDPETHLANEVAPNSIYVAGIKDKSNMVPALMSLYSTDGEYPKPHQIMFCQPETTWEEINLVLLRCFYNYSLGGRVSLFSIVNTEYLDFNLQSKLVTAIISLRNSVKQPFRLALIVYAGDSQQQHLLDQFSSFVRTPTIINDAALRKMFKGSRGEVTVVTSSYPGMGKTEQITRRVYEQGKLLVTFPVSGPISRSRLIERLGKLASTFEDDVDCLHLDLGLVTNPYMINTFLFEMLVIGSVSSGASYYPRPNGDVFIEIANTLDQALLNSLPICKYFNNVNLVWNPTQDMVVSMEVTSPIQIVCKHLYALFHRTIDTTDLSFAHNSSPLPAMDCIQLLTGYFFLYHQGMSYTILNVFLAFFADQLVKFNMSHFFSVASLEAMVGKGSNVRKTLVKSLLKVSEEFAQRAAGASSAQAAQLHRTSAQQAVERVSHMIKWDDSNHLMIVFHSQDSQTISALYKKPAEVPSGVIKLLQSQHLKGGNAFQLQDYANMTSAELMKYLEKIASTSFEHKSPTAHYALTADNLLKMVLILLRIRGRIPVVIMGETGCGKTSLIKFLANIIGNITFSHLDFHAGITEEYIINFITNIQNKAAQDTKQYWIFLDEINTCDHLGLVSELICHRSMLGTPLISNLNILAACNPYKYRIRKPNAAGLEGKIRDDELSALAYRVHPLPEALMDYVWDYGALAPADEKLYITAITEGIFPSIKSNLIPNLISASQHYIRTQEAPESVSMRDVKRCKMLIEWFRANLRRTRKLDEENPAKGRAATNYKRDPGPNDEIRAIILALSHCYHSRLGTTEQRQNYRNEMARVFSQHKQAVSAEGFLSILRAEQKAYIDSMDCPEGTALNSALLENVFVLLVCILNKIPVFVVGKPGCSKSLSMQLIYSNLRGKDSKNEFFKYLPQIFIIAFQGSESSTSEGIMKVFDLAKREKAEGVLPVVLLDEVGLAEISKSNPLKVLHGLIEPEYPKEQLDIAVVGISNWALDAAKMNRAIHLYRPEPDAEDLRKTGVAIQKAFKGDHDKNKAKLKHLADAYYAHHASQLHKNFHGLRDYYSLVKYLSRTQNFEVHNVITALERNFGGLPAKEMDKTLELFVRALGLMNETIKHTPVLDLIQANLKDQYARHLMIISSGDAAIGILDQYLKQNNVQPVIIYGSKFPEDRSEHYSYRILSQIILCMETGRCMILKDLEDIYGSLYDMLNQNYTEVSKKRNCRIALDANNNPMCHVHENFRCIVLVDRTKIDYSDPPFLNRFEKQMILYEDVLGLQYQKVLESLVQWVQDISCYLDFEQADMFMGFHEDTLSSVVLLHASADLSPEEILEKCKEDLIMVASVDAIVRAASSPLAACNVAEIHALSSVYFTSKIHNSLHDFISVASGKWQDFGDTKGIKTVVMTHSSIHVNPASLVGPLCPEQNVQVHKVGAFTSEKQLSGRVQAFFSDDSKSLLVLQCSSIHDAAHILLAKSTIDQQRAEHKFQKDIPKHVLILIHLHRGLTSSTNERWQLNFQCGWKQVTVDSLEISDLPIVDILSGSIVDLFEKEVISLEKCISQAIDWAFTCIKYPESTRASLEYIMDLKNRMKGSSTLIALFKDRILEWMREHQEKQWQAAVASDKKNLLRHSSLHEALVYYIQNKVNTPLAMIIFVLEKMNSLWTYFYANSRNTLQDEWHKLYKDNKIVDISSIMEPKGTECYTGIKLMYKLQFPFSLHFIKQFETYRNLFASDTTKIEADESSFDPESGNLTREALLQQVERMQGLAAPLLEGYGNLFQANYELFLDDFLTIRLSSYGLVGKLEQGKKLLKAMMNKKMELKHPIDVFVCWWRHENLLLTTMQLVFNVDNPADITEKFLSEEYLVQTLCESMLPFTNKIAACGGTSNWQKQLNIILSKLPALKISLPSTVNLLRICNDFVNTVLRSPTTGSDLESPKSIEILSNLATALTSSETGTEVWFTNVLSVISGLFKGEEAQNQFICAFMARALTLTSDENYAIVLDLVLENIVKNAGLVAQAGLVINSLIRDVEEEGLLSVLAVRDLDGSSYNVEALNSALITAESHYKEKDNIFAALCCDVIQRNVSTQTISASVQESDATLEHFNSAIQILCAPKSQPFLTIISTAYLKQFAKLFAKLILADKFKDISTPVKHTINAALTQTNSRIHAVKILILKELSADLSIFDVRNTCVKHTETFPWLSFTWAQDQTSPIPFNIFSTYDLFNEFSDAFNSAIVRGDTKKIEELLSKCEDLSCAKSLLGTSAMYFYFINASRTLNTSEQRFADWLISSSGKLNPVTKHLLLLLISNFKETNGMLELKTTSNPNIVHLASVIVYFLIELTTTKSLMATPFFNYVFSPCDINANYLPGEPYSEADLATQALEKADMHLFFNCTCGYVYNHINCDQNAVCENPQCQQPLAGLERTTMLPPQSNTPQNAKPGVVQGKYNSSPTVFVRNMTPAQYRVLHLLTHLAFFLRIELQLGTPLTEHTTNMEALKKHFQTSVVNDWMLLPTVLNQTSKDICGIFLYMILGMDSAQTKFSVTGPLLKAEDRDKWETEFTNYVSGPVLQNPDKTVDALNAFISKKEAGGKGTIETEVQEKVEKMSAEYKSDFLPRILRRTAELTKEDLCTRLTNDTNFCQKYPFLVLFFRMESQLGLIKHLIPIMEWVNILTNKLSHRIDRQTAQNMKIEEFISQNKNILEEPFKRFATAWNSIRKSVNRFRCREFSEPPPEITANSPIIFCCAQTSDDGLYICGALELLKNLQNVFLEEVIRIAAHGCRSLLYVQGGMRSSPINEVKESEVVVYDWSDEILQYSQLNLEYGRGKEVIYNFAKIELELAHSLVSGKAIIDMENFAEFEFHRELFHGFSTILQDIKVKVPQEKLSSEKISTLKNDSRIVEKASQILQTLDYVIPYVKQTGALPTQPLLDYCKHWKLDLSAFVQIYSALDVQLRFLVSLYEEVEDLISSKVVEAVDQAYTEEVPSECKEGIVKLAENLSAPDLMITFRRFIFRYISAAKIESTTPLIDHLATILLCCPVDAQKNEVFETHLDPALKIAHVYQIYAFMRDAVNAQENKQIQLMDGIAPHTAKSKPIVQIARRKTQKFNNM